MDLPITSVYRPSTLDEAVLALAEEPTLVPIAGGTDVAVQLRSRKLAASRLLDLTGVMPAMISEENEGLRIGAGATMDDIARSDLVRAICPSLCDAAQQVGAWPIQCRATIGGNLANASPAADTAPPILVAEATIVVVSREGLREINVGSFFRGPGLTTLQPGELIHSIVIPTDEPAFFNRFTKLGWQREQIISVVSLAISLGVNDRREVTKAAVALGSVAPTPKRAPTVEAALTGRRLDSATREIAIQAVQDDITPIDDVRAPGWYRRVAAATLLERMLEEAAGA